MPRLESQELSALKSVYTKTCSFSIQGVKFWSQESVPGVTPQKKPGVTPQETSCRKSESFEAS